MKEIKENKKGNESTPALPYMNSVQYTTWSLFVQMCRQTGLLGARSTAEGYRTAEEINNLAIDKKLAILKAFEERKAILAKTSNGYSATVSIDNLSTEMYMLFDRLTKNPNTRLDVPVVIQSISAFHKEPRFTEVKDELGALLYKRYYYNYSHKWLLGTDMEIYATTNWYDSEGAGLSKMRDPRTFSIEKVNEESSAKVPKKFRKELEEIHNKYSEYCKLPYAKRPSEIMSLTLGVKENITNNVVTSYTFTVNPNIVTGDLRSNNREISVTPVEINNERTEEAFVSRALGTTDTVAIEATIKQSKKLLNSVKVASTKQLDISTPKQDLDDPSGPPSASSAPAW